MSEILLALVVLLNFALLGSGRIGILIRLAALQGMLIAALALLAALGPQGHGWRAGALAALACIVKGFVVPGLFQRVFDQLRMRREVEPFIGFTLSLLLMAAATIGAAAIGNALPLAEGDRRLAAAALATVCAGLLLLITRRKAITQGLGYLTLENGISLFGLSLIGGVPFLVETTLLLDLVAGCFLMVIVMQSLQRTFTTLDTRRLTALRE